MVPYFRVRFLHIVFVYRYVKISIKSGFLLRRRRSSFIVTLAFGSVSGGAKNWIKLGFISIQPSEFIKLLFIFYLASYFSGSRDKVYFGKIPQHTAVSFAMYVYLGFLVLQREWGISVLFFMIYIIMEYIF